MEPSSTEDQPFPTPPPYFFPDERQRGASARVYHIHTPYSPPVLPPSFSSDACSSHTHLPLPVTDSRPSTPRPKFVSYEMELRGSPAVTSCPSCLTQVTTRVSYKVGVYAWLMCLLFVLCGLVFGCCLIPFFVNHFRDAYHACPRCRRVLHIHRRTCCR